MLRRRDIATTQLAIMAHRRLDDATRELIRMDLAAYAPEDKVRSVEPEELLRWALVFRPGFRTVFYLRFRGVADRTINRLLSASRHVLPPVDTIEVYCKSIGGGLRIAHRQCVVSAKSIGENVSIGPGAVVGTGHGEVPTIEDGVHVCANSVVIGGITLGHNSIVGAGAVVLNDVAPNTTVVGNPAHPTSESEAQS